MKKLFEEVQALTENVTTIYTIEGFTLAMRTMKSYGGLRSVHLWTYNENQIVFTYSADNEYH